MLMRLYCVMLASLLLPALASAQGAGKRPAPAALTGWDAFERAEKLYAANRLAEAEPLYRKGLAGNDGLRLACLNRILPLYSRLGRHDQVVQTALASRSWLRARKENLRLRQLALQLGDSYLQLGHARTAQKELKTALANGPYPLSLSQQVMAWSLLGGASGRLGERAEATQCWIRVEQLARALLENRDAPLSPRERMDCLRNLVASYRQRGLADQALRELRQLYRLCLHHGDLFAQRDTLRELAGLYADRGEQAAAYRCLLGAAALHEQAAGGDRLTAGDLSQLVSRVCRKMGWRSRADSWRARAIACYEAVLKTPTAGQPEEAGLLGAFWRLHLLFQETSQFQKALALGETQESALGSLVQPRLQAEQGLVEAYLGAYARARQVLRRSVQALDEQTPTNLIDLPRALNNLAVVEQATHQLDRAEKLARRCLELYRTQELPTDSVQVEAHNLLGSFLANRGDYALAIDQFREGIALCAKLGKSADRQRSNLLLNTALLHKAQGDLERAFEACRQAREFFRPDGEPPPLALAAFDAALASLRSAQGRTLEAAALADRVLGLCRKAGVERGVLVVNAMHYLALRSLSRRDVEGAAKTWTKVRALQEAEKQSALLPRTLNHLALTEELSGRPDRAEAAYRKALELQHGNSRAYPSTHFITLWRLGALADARNSPTEARSFLEQAIAVAEEGRLRVYGDAQQRAGYLAQFAPAFESLVKLNLRLLDVEEAFLTIDRGRSRTLLDQLHLAGVDPLTGVPAEKGQALRQKEAELRRRLAAIRVRAQLLPLEALNDSRAKELTDELARTQKEYVELWREILHASPVYHSLLARPSDSSLLEGLRQRVLRNGTMMLVYHLGEEQSHVLLLGGKGVAEAFPLEVSAGVAERIAAAPAAATGGLGTRGLRLRRADNLPPPPMPSATPAGPNVPLTLRVARALIDQYLGEIADPDFVPTRGLRLRPRKVDAPLAVQRLEVVGEIFVPEALRRRLREHKATQLVVIPDGPLHKLPLEALLLQSGERAKYVLDELPPLVYAPSASVLLFLSERPHPVRKGPPSLLTVGDPAYRQSKAKPTSEKALTLLALRGELPLLPGTKEESRRIRAYFDRDRVTALEGAAATERAVVAALPGSNIVHLAVHGFADERFGNLFGALAFTPPEKEDVEGDGFLSLHEIYQLRLNSCELAVLSACSTHVGPQRPLEAGVTLATAFLAAGAQRVVASHWSVDDRSTAELMSAFFAAVTAPGEKRLGCARALQQARQAVRARKGWSSPYYWAPFVLVGPPDEPAK